jgi:hypothetical protein
MYSVELDHFRPIVANNEERRLVGLVIYIGKLGIGIGKAAC